MGHPSQYAPRIDHSLRSASLSSMNSPLRVPTSKTVLDTFFTSGRRRGHSLIRRRPLLKLIGVSGTGFADSRYLELPRNGRRHPPDPPQDADVVVEETARVRTGEEKRHEGRDGRQDQPE